MSVVFPVPPLAIETGRSIAEPDPVSPLIPRTPCAPRLTSNSQPNPTGGDWLVGAMQTYAEPLTPTTSPMSYSMSLRYVPRQVIPASPLSPCGPTAPISPFDPSSPFAPCIPSAPRMPSMPFVPLMPSRPSRPRIPFTPSFPAAPSMLRILASAIMLRMAITFAFCLRNFDSPALIFSLSLTTHLRVLR